MRWTLDEIVLLLDQNGFFQVGGKGSHRVFAHATYDAPIVLSAHGNKIKSGYIREVRGIFDALEILE